MVIIEQYKNERQLNKQARRQMAPGLTESWRIFPIIILRCLLPLSVIDAPLWVQRSFSGVLPQVARLLAGTRFSWLHTITKL